MSPVVVLIIALVAVALAWKLLKGTIRTVALTVILVLTAIFVFGGFQ